MRTWGSGNKANFKNNKKDILNSGNEGRRCAVVKFAKLCYVWRPRGRLRGTQLVISVIIYIYFFLLFFSVIVVKNYNNNNNNNNNMATG